MGNCTGWTPEDLAVVNVRAGFSQLPAERCGSALWMPGWCQMQAKWAVLHLLIDACVQI